MKADASIRRALALVLAAAILWGSSSPGRAKEMSVPPETTVPVETTIPEETTVPVETTIPEETTVPTETIIPEETTVPTETIIPEETTIPTEETLPEETTFPEETLSFEETLMTAYIEAQAAGTIRRFGSQETPLPASQSSVATLGSGSGIKFRIFNYTNGQDASGNYISAGGINDNGLDGWFNFRGTSCENTAADGSLVSSFTNEVTDLDGYTDNHATVLPNLGSDGYPVFDGSRDNGPRKSLGYLFGAGGRGVTGYAPENTLLRQNSRGQYYYNSADNAVDFDTVSNRFIVRTYRERGKTTATQGTGQYYDFFPFTYWDGTTIADADTAQWYNFQCEQEVDYWYGMTMEAAFSMPEGGMVEHGTGSDEMVFEFSGDDDVWVFIDGVLVLDLGGTHGVVSGSINFATGEVKQYLDWNGTTPASAGTSYPTTLEARFQQAGKEPNGGWSDQPGTHGRIFEKYTEHTIRFYYLERAAGCANCKILFNMPILPTGKLTVEKQVEGTLTAVTAEEAYGFSLQEQDGTPAAGIRFDRFDAATGTHHEIVTTGPDGSFFLKLGQRAEFDLTAGRTYLIRETDPGSYAQPHACTVNGVLQPSSGKAEGITMDPDVLVPVVFTNRLDTTSVTVRKQVAGNLGDRDQLFDFVLRIYDGPPEDTGRFVEERSFRLKHGQEQREEDIPIGGWLVLTETRAEGYETRYQAGQTTGTGQTVSLGELLSSEEILYTNTREVLIDTGVTLDTVPCWLLSASPLTLVFRRKKKERL